MKRLAITIILLISIPLSLKASDYPGAVFLMIFPGARAVGLAGAFSAIADDAYATYYNPAGLAFQNSIDFSHSYCDWLPGLYPGMKYKYTCFSLPITKRISIGGSVDYLSTGEVDVINDNGDFLGSYTPYDVAVGTSIGIKVNQYNSVGITGKYIYSLDMPDWVLEQLFGLHGGTAKLFAFDLGALSTYSSIFGNTSIGLVIQNIGPKIKYTHIDEGDRLPLAVKLGFSHKITAGTLFPNTNPSFWLFKWFLDQSHISISYDIRKDLADSETPWYSYGAEFTPFAVFSVRYGYFIDSDGVRRGSTFSYGLDFKFLRIDYGDDSDIYDFPTDNKRLSITINIGTPFLSDAGILGLFNNYR
jgi:hypothetical protein